MASQNRRWAITSDKFLNPDQVDAVVRFVTDQRDLAIARKNHLQAIRDYYAVRTLLETGLRVFEFCALIGSDFQGQKLLVRHGKGDKARTVLLTRPTALMLKEWAVVRAKLGHDLDPSAPLFPSRFGRAYTTRGVQKRIKTVFKAIGLPQSLSVHSLRHTYCTLLLASGKVGIATVKENLGHHSIAVTNLYSHAIGNLDDVDLYATPSSEKAEFSELRVDAAGKKSNDSVKAFLRNMNFKRGDGHE